MEIEWKHEDITFGDLTMHYARSYSPGQPPLVLAHGFSDSGMCWLPVAQALMLDYDVILPDARGHGLSSRVQPDQQIDGAADLAGFIQALELSRPIVGGHSMGAFVAAAMDGRFPGLAGALLLEDPPWRDNLAPPAPPPGEAPSANPFADWLNGMKNRSIDEIIAEGKKNSPTWAEAEWLPWAESKQRMDLNFVAARGTLPQQPWRDVVRAITAPTLLITASPERGAIVTPEVALEAQELNSRIQVVTFEEAGHNIRREAFEPFMEAVLAFLEEL